MDDFALLRPAIVASTPRLWNLLYNQYLKALHKVYIQSQTQASQKISASGTTPPSSDAATTAKKNCSFEHFDPAQVPAELRETVMSMFKSKLGGRERVIVATGALTALSVKRFVIDCFVGRFKEIYGSTEVMTQKEVTK